MAAQLSATAQSSLSEINLIWPEPDLQDNRFSAQVPESFGKAKVKDQAAPPLWKTAVDGATKRKEKPRSTLVEGAQKDTIKISKETKRIDTFNLGEGDRSKWFERNIKPMVPQKAEDVLPFDTNLVLDFLGEDFEPPSLDSITSKVEEGVPLPGLVESSPASEEVESISVTLPEERNAQEPLQLQNVPQLSPACGVAKHPANLGCFAVIEAIERQFPQLSPLLNVSADDCMAYCSSHQFPYAALRGGDECRCGYRFDPKSFSEARDDLLCDAPCLFQRDRLCGGSRAFSIFLNPIDINGGLVLPSLTTELPAKFVPDSSARCNQFEDGTKSCLFENLYYTTALGGFVFILGPSSVTEGILLQAGQTLLELIRFGNGATKDLRVVRQLDIKDSRLVEGTTAFLYRRNSSNLLLTIHDDLLPMYSSLARTFDHGIRRLQTGKIRVLLLDTTMHGAFGDLLPLFSARDLLTRAKLKEETPVVCFEAATFPVARSWYSWRTSAPEGPVANVADEIGTELRDMSDFILRELPHAALYSQFRPSTSSSGQAFLTLLSSRKTGRILNEDELLRGMQEAFQRQLVVLDIDTSPASLMAYYISQTDLLIGVHGPHLGFGVFLPPQSTIVEIFPYGIPALRYSAIKTTAQLKGMNLNYIYWENKILENSIGYPERPQPEGGLLGVEQRLRDEIITADVVPEANCCDSLYYTYRCGQDTLVDVPDLIRTIRKALKDTQQ